MNDQPTTEPELVDADWCPLVLLALEIGEDPDRLAKRLGALVVSDDLGFRSVTAATARSVVAVHHERQAAAIERARRRQAEAKAQPRRRIQHGPSLEVPEGMTPAQVMVALDGRPDYEGHWIPRPSSNPFEFSEGGGLIGPPRAPRRKRGAS
jgi:hypothetical protein